MIFGKNRGIIHYRGDIMADYKAMYLKLFNEVTDTIERLQKIQQECEEIYIKSEEENLKNFEIYKNEIPNS